MGYLVRKPDPEKRRRQAAEDREMAAWRSGDPEEIKAALAELEAVGPDPGSEYIAEPYDIALELAIATATTLLVTVRCSDVAHQKTKRENVLAEVFVTAEGLLWRATFVDPTLKEQVLEQDKRIRATHLEVRFLTSSGKAARQSPGPTSTSYVLLDWSGPPALGNHLTSPSARCAEHGPRRVDLELIRDTARVAKAKHCELDIRL